MPDAADPVPADQSVIDGLLDEKKTEMRQKAEAWVAQLKRAEAHELALRLLKQLIERIDSQNLQMAWPSDRVDGLVALRELTFLLESDWGQLVALEICRPVLFCFSDEDGNVRYKACEAFYNVAKVIRGGILPDMSAVFDGLCRLYTDVEQTIKEGAQALDRLIRDIVVEQRRFDFSTLIPLIGARIHVLNPSVRQLVLGWIVLLDSLPQVDMIAYLPHYLEGLFGILASDNRDFRLKAQECLDGLLEEIRKSPTERPERSQRAIAQAAATVGRCCRAGGELRSEDAHVRFTALKWLLELVKLQVELEAAGDAVRHGGDAAQGGLRHLVPELLPGALYCLDDSEDSIRKDATKANEQLMEAVRRLDSDLPVEPIANVVVGAMLDVGGQERSKEVLLKCFSWLELLLERCPESMVRPEVRQELLGAAEAALLRREDEVAATALRFAAQLTAIGEQLSDAELGGMVHRLFGLMKAHPELQGRGELVVRKVCDGLLKPSEDVRRFFATAARAIEGEEDRGFARRLVRVLNRGLLMGTETKSFRAQLRREACAREGERPELQMVLMRAWMVCPVSSLALSFWLNEFDFATGLATRLAMTSRTEETQAQLRDFVELLESPAFSDVRLQMLAAEQRASLLRAMLQLGALLPQEPSIQGRLRILELGLLLERVEARGVPQVPRNAEADLWLQSFEKVCELHRWREVFM